MTTLTKVTLVTFESTLDALPDEWVTETLTKAEEMKTAGKTDAVYEFVDLHTTKRHWLDQPAADEWSTFITTCSETYSVVITNIAFEDASITF